MCVSGENELKGYVIEDCHHAVSEVSGENELKDQAHDAFMMFYKYQARMS